MRTVLQIFHYFLQLIFRLTPLTSATKSNEKLVNQNTVLIFDALYHDFGCVVSILVTLTYVFYL